MQASIEEPDPTDLELEFTEFAARVLTQKVLFMGEEIDQGGEEGV